MSVVGKYRYHMYSPAEHDRVPVIVDIILVGRTKIITLHSGIWLENRCDRKVSFRLHVPITPLVAPGARANMRQTGNDAQIGPLKPGAGLNPFSAHRRLWGVRDIPAREGCTVRILVCPTWQTGVW